MDMQQQLSLACPKGTKARACAPHYPINEGVVLVAKAQNEHRRVVAVHAGRVFYSKGGDRLYDCLEQTLRRWASRQHAKLAHAASAH
jgi:hypothetical protein